MCSLNQPKQFGAPSAAGQSGNTTTPATVYASSANPSLTNAGTTPIPTGPASAPAALPKPGQPLPPGGNPYLQMLQSLMS